MKSVTIRNVPDEVHRAIRLRAAQHDRSTEAEIREILQATIKPQNRVKLGSVLFEIGRKVNLSEDEFAIFETLRDRTQARAARFE